MKRCYLVALSVLISLLLIGCDSASTPNSTIDGDFDIDNDTVVVDGDEDANEEAPSEEEVADDDGTEVTEEMPAEEESPEVELPDGDVTEDEIDIEDDTVDTIEDIDTVDDTDTVDDVDVTEMEELPTVCEAGGRECFGNTVFICNSNGTGYLAPEPCGDEQFCADGACVNFLCDPGSALCEDMSSYKVCEANGSGYGEAVPCGTDRYCRFGSCFDMICEPDTLGCVGNAYAQCMEDGSGWGAATNCNSDQYCLDGQCEDQICTPNTWICDGIGARRLCATDGSGYADPELCGDNQYCEAGQCLDQICEPLEVQCEENAVITCNAIGDGWSQPVACEDGTSCVDGVCLATLCDPGSSVCSGNAVLTCNGNGDGYEAPVPCGDTQYCLEGACLDQACSPQSRECDANGDVLVCDALGSAWDVPVPCEAGQYCLDGYCLNQACNPGEQICESGTAYKVCNSQGSAWETPVDCLNDTLCVQGECLTPLCNPNEATCEGNSVVVCNPDGMGYSSPVACGDGRYCDTGICYQQICEPESYACEGNAVKQCNEQGSAWSAPVDCQDGTLCSDGVCQAQLCNPGESSCQGNAVVVCNQDGMGYSNPVDCGEGRYCENGVCNQEACEPESYACEGNAVKQCNSQGSAWSDPVACIDGTYCLNGVCENQVCIANERTCADGFSYHICTSTGLGYGDAVSCGNGFYCNDADGQCMPQVCEPAASECTGPTSYKDCADNGSMWQGPFYCQGEDVCEDGQCKDPSQVADTTIVVELVRPQPGETLSLTQGDSVNVLVNAYVNGSGSIADVELLIDGESQGTDAQAPYEFTFTIPVDAVTGHTYELQAEANSTLNRYNVSQAAFIEVRNDPPNAAFTAVATSATTVIVDASASSDTESAAENLLVRWDWENDGTWDTDFATEKIAEYDYGQEGTFTIACEVKDEVEQNDIVTHSVILTSTRYISGTLDASDTWSGTVIITGDITITNGATITVLPGTNVLFTYSDVEPVGSPDGIGDYGIDVIGGASFDIQGTEAEPVVFSVNGTDHRHSKAWDHISLSGAPSSFQHVIVEYGTTCLAVQDATSFQFIESRFCNDGMVVTNGDGVTVANGYFHNNDDRGLVLQTGTDTYDLQDIESAHNGTDGIQFTGGSDGSLVRCSVHNNGQDGIAVDSSDVDISECVRVTPAAKFGDAQNGISYNARYGLNYTGSPGGLVTHNDIVYNGAEGIRLVVQTSSPVINWNNIYSNSSVGGYRLATANTSGTLSTSGRASYTTITSGYWTAPDNGDIVRVKINYSESSSDGSVSGGIYKSGGSSVWSTSYNRSNYWVDIPEDVQSVAVYIRNTGYTSSYYSHSITGAEVVYQIPESAGVEMSASAVNNVIDAQFNYWGIFPNSLSAISMDHNDTVNMQGFVGVAFDETWDRGPYISGAFTEDATLNGTIYITGDTTVSSGVTLTLQPNTDVQFVKHDQNVDGVGDFTITVDGTISAVGNAANRISFDGVGDFPETDSYEGIILNGQGSVLQYVDISNGLTNLRLNTCAATLDNLTVADASDTGVYLNNLTNSQTPPAYDAVFSNSTISGCDEYGIQVYDGAVSLSYLTIINNEGTGLYVKGGGANVSLLDSTIRNNDGNGLTVTGLTDLTASYNVFGTNQGVGVEISGDVSGVLSYSEVSLNQREGFFVYSSGGVTPDIAITNNNIFANSVNNGMTVTGENTSISTSGRASYTTITSSYWTVPDSGKALAAKINYSESSSDGYVSGGIYKTGNSSVWSTSYNVSNRWVDLSSRDISSLAVYITNTGYTSSYYSHSISCNEVIYGKVDGAGIDMTAFSTNTNRINAHNNWWNSRLGGQIVEVLSDYPVGTVDYAGAVGNQWTVGPR